MNRAVIALGSNIRPEANTEAALGHLSQLFDLVDKSCFKYTRPVGYKDQPDFLNGAVLVETGLKELKIEAILKEIEQKLGRKRDGRKDGPRTIDLDLVVYNDRIMDEDVYERDFLQESIKELVPDLSRIIHG